MSRHRRNDWSAPALPGIRRAYARGLEVLADQVGRAVTYSELVQLPDGRSGPGYRAHQRVAAMKPRRHGPKQSTWIASSTKRPDDAPVMATEHVNVWRR